MNVKRENTEIILWTAFVLILSFFCYLPMLLDKKGINVFEAALGLKYLFLMVPLAVSVFFTWKNGTLKKWFPALFAAKIKVWAIFNCIISGSTGLAFSVMYCLITGEKDLFTKNYPDILAVVIGCSYLFLTALLEESAWRGFLLDRIAAVKGKRNALIYVGVIWAIWHIPMWSVRNSLGFMEILIYFMWTILVSFLLGTHFYKYKDILTVSLLHMLFNSCFLAPVKYNVILLGCITALMILMGRKKNVTLQQEERKY